MSKPMKVTGVEKLTVPGSCALSREPDESSVYGAGVCPASTDCADRKLVSVSVTAFVVVVSELPLTSADTEGADSVFSITLASIGDRVVSSGLASSSFGMDVGFDAAYRPPGEVAAACGTGVEHCLRFTDPQTLIWPGERSAGVYNLYRDDTSDGFGHCEQQDLADTTATDAATPTSGTSFFYLVTVENRLGEEGTKGFGSNTSERLGAVCP